MKTAGRYVFLRSEGAKLLCAYSVDGDGEAEECSCDENSCCYDLLGVSEDERCRGELVHQ